ncbi:DUF3472 domain-containing protein [bacterium]|nr:DUF3472 domain-containing protein [bacterium]
MNTHKKYFIRMVNSFIVFMLFLLGCSKDGSVLKGKENIDVIQWDITVPTAGNSWVIESVTETGKMITESGITNWSNPDSRIRTFFYLEQTGKFDFGLRVKVASGQSKIKITLGDETKEIALINMYFDNISVGPFTIKESGYQYLEIQGVEKSSTTFAEISDILIGGVADTGTAYFVKDDFYWGRRGPSVHLSYEQPEDAGEARWFYNELTIPEGNDILGSYFMANGFAEGYFGIQVNSSVERRILFSVWSPYQTDNPGEIPDDYKIILLKKGEGVHTGEFGNEGSGGQSYRKYFWKAGTTYRFLLKGEPAENNSTDYTAYFFAPEIGEWELIASFRRPKTVTYLKRLHSFLENFITETGDTQRKGLYSRQWMANAEGQWHELTRARFTADATARTQARLDYSGGVENGMFFLQNCGFFSERSLIDSFFNRDASGAAPIIDFSALPGE